MCKNTCVYFYSPQLCLIFLGSWYMYLQCNGNPGYRHSALISPEEQPVFKKCLKFSYNMHGSKVFVLKIYMQTVFGWGDAIWRVHSNHGPDWKTAIFPITSFQPFQVASSLLFSNITLCVFNLGSLQLLQRSENKLPSY